MISVVLVITVMVFVIATMVLIMTATVVSVTVRFVEIMNYCGPQQIGLRFFIERATSSAEFIGTNCRCQISRSGR